MKIIHSFNILLQQLFPVFSISFLSLSICTYFTYCRCNFNILIFCLALHQTFFLLLFSFYWMHSNHQDCLCNVPWFSWTKLVPSVFNFINLTIANYLIFFPTNFGHFKPQGARLPSKNWAVFNLILWKRAKLGKFYLWLWWINFIPGKNRLSTWVIAEGYQNQSQTG